MMSETEFTALSLSEPESDVDCAGARPPSKERTISAVCIAGGDLGDSFDAHEMCIDTESVPAIDLEALMDRCMDDFDLVVEVIESFCDQCLSRVRSLESALHSADSEQIFFDLDFLSGAAKNVGAQHLDDSISSLVQYVQKCGDSTSGNVKRVGSLSDGWRVAFGQVMLEFQRAVKYWKDFRVQTGNDDEDDMASTLRLESYLASCASVHDGAETAGSNWSATEDELAQQQHVVNELAVKPLHDGSTSGYSANLFRATDWTSLETMDAFFEGSKEIVSHMRECWVGGTRRHQIRDLADKMLELSSRAGLVTLCRKLQALVDNAGPALRCLHIDAVEQQLDASIAIWSSCRLKI